MEFKKKCGIMFCNGDLSEDDFTKVLDSIFNKISEMGCSDDPNENYVPVLSDESIIFTSGKNDMTYSAFAKIKEAMSFIKRGYMIMSSFVNDYCIYDYRVEFHNDRITVKYIGGELYEEDKE